MLGICRQKYESRPLLPLARFRMLHLVDRALLRMDQRSKFRKQHLADGDQIALALQHAGEFRQIGLQPVLLLVSLRRAAQVVDHRIDVVFQFGDFSAGFDLNRSRQIALGHGRRDFRDGANLVGQIRGEKVDVRR